MAKKATLTDVSSGYASGTTLNANFDAINDKLDNTLSLDGSTPNAMGADLDMNSNDINNVGTVNTTTLKVGGTTFVPASATSVYTPEWQGAWVTATAYALNDLVQESGNTYICVEAHTSGTFATDLAAVKWELFASKGTSGAGSGDLVSTNNLSDLTNADTALANLGGGTTGIALFKDTTSAAARTELGLVIGTDVQAYDAELAALAGLASAANKVPYFTGSGTAGLLDFVDEDDMSSDSATAVPSQQSVKAYVDSSTSSLGSVTLIENKSVPSASSYTFSGLDLTNYKFVRLVFDGVAVPTSTELAIGTSSITGTVASGSLYGYSEIDLTAQSYTTVYEANASGVKAGSQTVILPATTSFTVSWNSVNFGGGNILLYGIK